MLLNKTGFVWHCVHGVPYTLFERVKIRLNAEENAETSRL